MKMSFLSCLRLAVCTLFLTVLVSGTAFAQAAASSSSSSSSSGSGGEAVIAPANSIAEVVGAAEEAGQAAKKETWYGQIIDWFVMLYELYMDQYDDFLKRVAEGYSARLTAEELAQRVKMNLAQAILDSRSHNVLLNASMEYYRLRTPPKNEYLCKAITALSIAGTSMDHEREVSRMMAEAINNRYRCPTCDGSGPDYTAHELQRSCQRKNGTLVSGDPATCRSDVKGEDGRSLAGAPIAPIDGITYEMPPIVSKAYKDEASGKTITVNMPADTGLTPKQEFWHAAWDHCYNIAGPRPTPAHGKAMNTPVGKTQRAMFNHCAASQNALVKQCTDWVAFHTRPNCQNNAALCARQKDFCKTMEKIVDLSAYDNCDRGLSPREEGELAQGMCKAGQHYLSNAQAGQTQDRLQRSIDKCETADKAFLEYIAIKQRNYERSVLAMQVLKPCWSAVEALGRHAASSYGGDEEDQGEVANNAAPSDTGRGAANAGLWKVSGEHLATQGAVEHEGRQEW